MFGKMINTISKVVVVVAVAKDEVIVKYNDVRVQVAGDLAKAKKDLLEKKEKDVTRYIGMYPELFVDVETKDALDKAIFAAMKREYVEGRKVKEVKVEQKEETIKEMLERIKKHNEAKK